MSLDLTSTQAVAIIAIDSGVLWFALFCALFGLLG